MTNLSFVLDNDNRIGQSFSPDFVNVSEKIGRYEETKNEVKAILDSIELCTENLRVLDVPCGVGRHVRQFQEYGCSVSGVDIDPEQIEIARSMGARESFFCQNMMNLQFPAESFDLIVNLFSSFGYSKTVADDLSILRSFYDLLSKGGYLIMQLSDLERSVHSLGDKTLPYRRNAYEELNFDWEMQTLMVSYFDEAKVVSIVNMRIYSKEQLREMILKSGFSECNLYGSFDRKEKRSKDRLVIYARK